MKSTLSLILPVYNVETILRDAVVQMVEVLPELTTDFEILIVDDGSTDETITVAQDLAREYPQIQTIRNSEQEGTQAVTQLGLRMTTGEIVMVQEDISNVCGSQFHQLWQLRNDSQLVMVRPDSEEGADQAGTLKMLRRTAIARLSDIEQPEQYLQVQPMIHAAHENSVRVPQHIVRMKQGIPRTKKSSK